MTSSIDSSEDDIGNLRKKRKKTQKQPEESDESARSESDGSPPSKRPVAHPTQISQSMIAETSASITQRATEPRGT